MLAELMLDWQVIVLRLELLVAIRWSFLWFKINVLMVNLSLPFLPPNKIKTESLNRLFRGSHNRTVVLLHLGSHK